MDDLTERERRLLQLTALMAIRTMTDQNGIIWHSNDSILQEVFELLEEYDLIGPGEWGWVWTERGKALNPDYFLGLL